MTILLEINRFVLQERRFASWQQNCHLDRSEA
jgi:hypothetical protein